mgnify:CR=1 FL=1|tara:strand:+ start:691 stop:909 length:219 start_codon:yes stop_codon:yes gene_type:complete
MGKKIAKYVMMFSAVGFLSSSEIGQGSYIMIGPFSLNPAMIVKPIKEKVIEPIEDIYEDVKKKITKKKKRKR